MEQLFGLNPQLLHDTVLMVFAILFLFTLMSYLLFNPATVSYTHLTLPTKLEV